MGDLLPPFFMLDKREDGRVFLSSISGRYLFSIMESDDKDWEIIK